jgi:predicted transcriptional regulator
MSYESVDKLQNALGEKVFNYAQDKKKVAGRAMGNTIEIITYYLLKTWGFNNSISIERKLVEYGNQDISHNVEYSLHPILNEYEIIIPNNRGSITANNILKKLEKIIDISQFERKNNNLLDNQNILRNACTIGESKHSFLLTSFKSFGDEEHELFIFEQMQKPYAIFECKRVGIEEGNNRGPQTIEKAKQGA